MLKKNQIWFINGPLAVVINAIDCTYSNYYRYLTYIYVKIRLQKFIILNI